MKPFIHVFNKVDAEVLQRAGYELLVADENNERYIFENRETQEFAQLNIAYCVSDMFQL